MADDNRMFDLMDLDQPSTENSTAGNEQHDNNPNTTRHGMCDTMRAEEVGTTGLFEFSNLNLPPLTDTQAPFHNTSNTTLSFSPGFNQDLEVTHDVNRTTDGNIASTGTLRYHDTFPNPDVLLPSEAPNSMDGISGATLEEDPLNDLGIALSDSFIYSNDPLDLLLLGGTRNSMTNISEVAPDFTHDGNPLPHSSTASGNVFISPDIYMEDASLADNDENESSRSLANARLRKHENVSDHGTRRRRARFSRFQKDTLEQWISTHAEPYPTRNEQLELAQRTGLELRQIRSWFTRTRQRKLRRIEVPSFQGRARIQESHDNDSGGNSISHLLNESVSQRPWPSCASLPLRQRSPSQSRLGDQGPRSLPPYYTLRNISQRLRYRGSHEGSSLDAMPSMTDGVNLSVDRHGKSTSEQTLHPGLTFPCEQVSPKATFITKWLESISPHTYSPQPLDFLKDNDGEPIRSEDLFENVKTDRYDDDLSQNPHFEKSSCNEPIAWSNSRSASSVGSYMSYGSRRGRRQKFHPTSSTNNFDETDWRPASANGSLPSERSGASQPWASTTVSTHPSYIPDNQDLQDNLYCCIFCEKSFPSPYTWKRHEETIHAPQRWWVCKSLRVDSSIYDTPCPLCRKPVHHCSHAFKTCWRKPKTERAFPRKDCFRQHLELVHCKDTSSGKRILGKLRLDDWVEKVNRSLYDLRCHFCGYEANFWGFRAKHLADHFKVGMPMKEWRKGGPYLLSNELVFREMASKDVMVMNAFLECTPEILTNRESRHDKYSHRFRSHQYSDVQSECERRMLEPLLPEVRNEETDLVEEHSNFTPRWTRHHEGRWKGWCGICRPGQWVDTSQYAYERHVLYVHGGSEGHYASKLPSDTWLSPDTKGLWLGLCGDCDSWIPLVSNRAQWKSWFIHHFTKHNINLESTTSRIE